MQVQEANPNISDFAPNNDERNALNDANRAQVNNNVSRDTILDYYSLAKYFFMGYKALIALILLYGLFGFIIHQSEHDHMAGVTDYLHSNLIQSPISDIKIVVNTSCPENYETKILAQWPGTQEGCYCRFGGHLYTKSCSANNKTYCDDIYEKDPEPITKWGSSKFCLKRYKNFEISYGYSCSSPYFKKCGTYLCIPEEDNCPVSNITLDNSNEIVTNPNMKIYPFTNNQTIKISYDSEEQPLVDIMVSFGDLPCLDPNVLSKRNYTYQLLKGEYGCGRYGIDSQAIVIDSLTEIQLYKDNDLLRKFVDLPGYMNHLSDTNTLLISRKRLNVRDFDICYGSKNTQKISEIGHKLSYVHTAFNIIIFISILIEIIYIVHYFVAKSFEIMHYYNVKLVFQIIQLVLTLLLFYLVNNRCDDLATDVSKITDILKLRCFQHEGINTVLKDISLDIPEAITFIPSFNIVLIFVNLISIIIINVGYLLKDYIKIKIDQI